MKALSTLSPADFRGFSLPAGNLAGGRLLAAGLAALLGGLPGGLLGGLLGGSSAAGAQSLTEAFAEAYRTNPQLLAQRALLRATDEQVPQALANWRPTVVFTGMAGYTVQAQALSGVPTAYTHAKPTSLDVTATQQVYRGGRTEAQVRQAINTVEAARAQTLAVETMVFQAVAQAHLDVVRDQSLVAVNRNNEYVLGQELESTRIRAEIGELTGTDVAQARSSLEQAKAQRVAAEGQLEVSRANYTRAVGRPPGRLTLPHERPALPATREDALRLAAGNNPGVIAAGFTELAARDNIDVVRGQLLPQVSVVGDVNRAAAGASAMSASGQMQAAAATTTGATLTRSVTATATMPVYEGGAIYSQTRQAQQTVGQRRSQVEDARRAAVQNAAQAWAAWQAARANIASFAAAVRAAQVALAGLQEEALTGTRTVLDVLVEEQQLFTTQQQLVTAEHDAALAEFTIAAAAGRLIAPELRLGVPLYDMGRHYKEVKDKWIGLGGGLTE
jgi:TolC family type I secretion outer membrane protein